MLDSMRDTMKSSHSLCWSWPLCQQYPAAHPLTRLCKQAHGQLGGEAQEWVRACLGCVGRGSNAQAVRDEILNIMHRNHIGEKRGTWMEARLARQPGFRV